MSESPGSTLSPRPLAQRVEARFERFLWRLRLIAILPVVMSLASTGATFVLGTLEIGKAILGLSHVADGTEKGYMAKVLGGVVTGIDLYLIGIALLIFGYGVYELLISPIDAAHQGHPRMRSGLLEISNLDQLKEKLVKVLVVALIVSAFKAMLTLPIHDGPTLVLFCLAVLLLALSGYLVANDRSHQPPG
ncbi:MAG: YqhA family protein [Cyanobium sp.]